MHTFYRGEFFNFEAIRILGESRYGGSDVAEFLDAIGQIREDDPATWHKAWADQAQKAEALAHEAEKCGHRNAARMAYFRASNYTRVSAYMMTGGPGNSDPRVVPILRAAISLFQKAIQLLDGQVHILQIPYRDGISLPAYLYLPHSSCRLPGKIPLLINSIGADSIQEEIYYMFPAEGPGLGYAVLTFEGPGQGLTLHEHNIPMRPDWDVVTSLVMDYIVKLADSHHELDLDLARVAIAGASLGGYFALRAAADARYKVCIAVDPVYDLWNFATKHVSPMFLNLWNKGWLSDGFVDAAIRLGMRLSFQMKWEILTSSRFLGTLTPSETLRVMQSFTLRQVGGSYLDQVKCPVFVTGASNSLYLGVDEHTAKIFKELSNPEKMIWVAARPGEGSLQAKMGALGLCNQRVFRFLDRQFGIERHEVH